MLPYEVNKGIALTAVAMIGLEKQNIAPKHRSRSIGCSIVMGIGCQHPIASARKHAHHTQSYTTASTSHHCRLHLTSGLG